MTRRAIAMLLVVCVLLLSSSGCNRKSESGYVGSAMSSIYHRPSCEWAAKISPANMRKFPTREAAAAAGYRPCKVCQP